MELRLCQVEKNKALGRVWWLNPVENERVPLLGQNDELREISLMPSVAAPAEQSGRRSRSRKTRPWKRRKVSEPVSLQWVYIWLGSRPRDVFNILYSGCREFIECLWVKKLIPEQVHLLVYCWCLWRAGGGPHRGLGTGPCRDLVEFTMKVETW